jgi:hypothetical protein
MNSLARYSAAACLGLLLVSGSVRAQQPVISSGAASAVGSAPSRPDCVITLYTLQNCPGCVDIKAQIEARKASNPAKYGCNKLDTIDCVGKDRATGRWLNPLCDASVFQLVPYPKNVNLCNDCDRDKPPPSPPPSNPGNPPSNPGALCTGEAKVPCANSSGGTTCCMYACDSSSKSGCLACSFRPCGASSCPAGEQCINKRNEKGCPQDFTCVKVSSPAPDPKPDPLPDPVPDACKDACVGTNMVCDPLTGQCRPKNESFPLLNPGPIDSPAAQNPDPMDSPAAPNPGAIDSPAGDNPPPQDPPAAPACGNPCPSADNANNCCGPTEGCYKGKCSTYSGCASCKAGQICAPINEAPYYACKDVKPLPKDRAEPAA